MSWRSRLLAGALTVVAIVTFSAAPANAFPSWEDVQNAKGNEAAKAAQVAEIEGFIAASQAQVAATQAEAERRGAEYQVAQDAFDQADFRATALQTQADASKAEADAATARAGLLAAQLYRTGGADLSADLMLGDEGQSDQFLAKLGQASKLAEINSGLYASAVETKNAAQSLSDQAGVARTEREKLRVDAEQKLAAAAAAAQAAQDQLAAQEEQNIILTQQLAALRDATAATTEQYQEGVKERQRAAAAAAAASGASGDYGQLSDQGWARPGSGRITDNFGARPSQPAGANAFHRGTDLGTGCSAPIYAATGGTVTYAGPNGTYGNFVLIDHGSGVSTGYAHIRSGGIFVNVGQYVDAGQNIASSGSTGASTACHLHFEVRINGSAIDAVPFMRDRGASLG